ncbi:MAG: right-handed parallel beta-helix repeat-containing protein, partial [bacterium]|nr:right-handed parallel beta-helix repeat-containing protein [bacterium]
MLVGLLWFGAIVDRADPRYVVEPGTAGGTNTGPYNTWAIAATQIQWAVDVAVDGETVWVSNGTFYLTNQISITNSITLQSFSGYYTNTVINGNYPAYTNRVVYVANTGTVLSGFTITNGCSTGQAGSYAFSGGGGFCAPQCRLITNCLLTGNKISNNTIVVCGGGGNLTSGTVSHCIFRGNKGFLNSSFGAGLALYYGIVSNCVISGNQEGPGGYGVLGPGISSTGANCVISDNTGIGVRLENPSAILYSSIVSNNSGSGIHFGQGGAVKNCLVVGNGNYGVNFDKWGSASPQMIDNCTIVN